MESEPIRVFVASPGDVSFERDALAKLVLELNLTISAVAPEKGVRLELVRWETHATPAAGRPQGVINDQIGHYDIFVGIMWRRFGTPSGKANSGTEEEFNRAYNLWQHHGRPEIMVYFCQAPAAPPKSQAEVEQLRQVVLFRDQLAKKALVWEYEDHGEFVDVVRPHLLKALTRAVATRDSPRARMSAMSSSELGEIRARLLGLVTEYTSVRHEQKSGDARTRQMELIATRIRTLALQGEPLLEEFVHGRSPGERLVAAAFLQVLPRTEYLSWLGERLSEKQPFVGYHAAVALLAGARTLDCSHRDALELAISDGLSRLGQKTTTDRYRTLMSARKELRERCR